MPLPLSLPLAPLSLSPPPPHPPPLPPSYSVYLELLYQDLLTSVGLTQTPCNGEDLAPSALAPSAPATSTSTGAWAGTGAGKGEGFGRLSDVVEASVVGAVNRKTAAAGASPSSSSTAASSSPSSSASSQQRDRGLSEASPHADDATIAYCQAYNLLLTPHWMLVVPRTERNFEGHVDINGLGFAGLLLAKDGVGSDAIARHGPLAVLQAVTYPV